MQKVQGVAQQNRRKLLAITAGIALAILGALLALLPRATKAQDGVGVMGVAGTIRVQPAVITTTVGGSSTVEVWLEGADNYYNLDIRLAFDPALVTVPAGKVTPLPGAFGAGSFEVKNEVDNSTGSVWYAVGKLNPAPPFSGSAPICSITFQGLAPGTAAIQVVSAQGYAPPPDSYTLYPALEGGQIVVLPLGDVHRLYLPYVVR
jgi:hypothetical protein